MAQMAREVLATAAFGVAEVREGEGLTLLLQSKNREDGRRDTRDSVAIDKKGYLRLRNRDNSGQ